jgi:transposase
MIRNSLLLALLSPPQWELFQSVLPASPPGRGRPAPNNRFILEAILYKLASGLPWYDLPARYPSHQTAYRRYR